MRTKYGNGDVTMNVFCDKSSLCNFWKFQLKLFLFLYPTVYISEYNRVVLNQFLHHKLRVSQQCIFKWVFIKSTLKLMGTFNNIYFSEYILNNLTNIFL